MHIKAIILGAGMGKRMCSDLPKVLHPICGRPMINLLLDSVHASGIDDITVVIGPNMPAVAEAVHPCPTVIQTERLGTAHAVLAAEKQLEPFDGCVLILFGDSPLSGGYLRSNREDCHHKKLTGPRFAPYNL